MQASVFARDRRTVPEGEPNPQGKPDFDGTLSRDILGLTNTDGKFQNNYPHDTFTINPSDPDVQMRITSLFAEKRRKSHGHRS